MNHKLDDNRKLMMYGRDYTKEERFMFFSSLSEIKEREIREECEKSIRSGFVSNALGSDYFYSSFKDEDQLNLLSAYTSGTSIMYACKNLQTNEKKMLLHSSDQIKKVFNDFLEKKTNDLNKFYDLIEKLNSSESAIEIESVQWI